MRDFVPLYNKRLDFCLEVGEVLEVWCLHALALKDREPLLHLVHPRAVHRRKVHLKTGMLLEPRPHHLAVVHADIVADEMDGSDFRWCRSVVFLESLEKFHLPFASAQDTHHLAGACIKGRKEVERSFAGVFVFKTGRQ